MLKLVCVVAVMLHSCNGQGSPVNLDWLNGLHENINRLNENIQRNVQNIQQNVQSQLRRVNEDISKLGESEALKNGQSVVITNSGGVSRVVYSGRDPNGQPYLKDSQDRVIDGILFHTERFYDPESKSIKEERYSLNLRDPNAKPIPLPVH